MKNNPVFTFVLAVVFVISSSVLYAHCDTKDGPVVADAIKALEQNNVNYVLKWVQPAYEKEIRDAFDLAKKVRVRGPEARELSDNYFFEILVRLHRAGEGVPYTGVKPVGTPIDDKILAADKSIELGNLSPLENLVTADRQAELKKRFEKVMLLKKFDLNDIGAGREYIEAYVQFFHFAEGEEGGHKNEHTENAGHSGSVSWILSGIFFITTILFASLYIRRK